MGVLDVVPGIPASPNNRSATSWMTQLPADWTAGPLKQVLASMEQGWSPQCLERPSGPGEWGVLKVGCVNGNTFDPSANKALPAELAPIPKLTIKKGDLLISRANTRELVGSAALAHQDYPHLMLCDKLFRLRFDEARYDPRYAVLVLRAPVCRVPIELAATGTSSSMVNIAQATVRNLAVPIPPLEQQVAIVHFVNRATKQLDALWEKQLRMLRLIEEKRKALVWTAITRGLNPITPLASSGCPWVANIPAHWTAAPLKHVIASIEQGWSPQCLERPRAPGEWGVLKVGCVNRNSFDSGENKALPPELDPIPRLAINQGDLLVSRANTRELVGSAALVQQDYPHLLLCDKLFRLRFDEARYDPRYAVLVLRSAVARVPIELAATGTSSSMVNIAQSTIRNLMVPIPPLNEQAEIVQHVALEVARLDDLAAKIRRQLDLVREHRAALITAAVTGQIDVRGQAQR